MSVRSRSALIAGIVVVVALAVVIALTSSAKMRREQSPLPEAPLPPGSAKAAAQSAVPVSPSRTYVVVPDVAFVRAKPDQPLPEERKSIKELEDMMVDEMPPYFLYGQNVRPEPGSVSTPGFACVALPERKYGYIPAHLSGRSLRSNQRQRLGTYVAQHRPRPDCWLWKAADRLRTSLTEPAFWPLERSNRES